MYIFPARQNVEKLPKLGRVEKTENGQYQIIKAFLISLRTHLFTSGKKLLCILLPTFFCNSFRILITGKRRKNSNLCKFSKGKN